MKLYHGEMIIPGLIIFVLLFTFPIWFNKLVPGTTAYDARLRQLDTENGCLFDTEEMRTSHMQKLNEWRDLVVRDAQRFLLDEEGAEVLDKDGKRIEMSLTKTCMKCHVNKTLEDAQREPDKAVHCSVCHEHVDVSIYCWDCHLDPANPVEGRPQKERN